MAGKTQTPVKPVEQTPSNGTAPEPTAETPAATPAPGKPGRKPGRKSDRSLSERALPIVDAIRSHKQRAADAQRKLDRLTAEMSDSEFEAFSKSVAEAPAPTAPRLVI